MHILTKKKFFFNQALHVMSENLCQPFHILHQCNNLSRDNALVQSTGSCWYCLEIKNKWFKICPSLSYTHTHTHILVMVVVVVVVVVVVCVCV